MDGHSQTCIFHTLCWASAERERERERGDGWRHSQKREESGVGILRKTLKGRKQRVVDTARERVNG
jgi:hypothetical protein